MRAQISNAKYKVSMDHKDRESTPQVLASIEPQVKQESVEAIPLDQGISTRSRHKTQSKGQLLQKEHNVIVQPRLKPVKNQKNDIGINDNRAPQCVPVVEGFLQSEDQPINRRGYKYKPCRPNPIFPSNLYSTTDLPPFKVRPSYFDRALGIVFSENMATVSTNAGWRSVRANVGVREGLYYMEFDIVRSNDDSKAHVRVGLARKEASLEAPVGFDGYSYGLRDATGQKLNLSRPKHFMDAGFKSGDTIGMLIELPPLDKHKLCLEGFDAQQKKHIPQKGDEAHKEKKRKKTKAKVSNPETALEMNAHGNIVRDQIPIKYKSSLYYEQFEYTTNKAMDHLLNPVTVFGEKAILESINNMQAQIPTIPDSKITVFKNGEKVGVMFENLYSFLPTFNEDELTSIFPNAIQLQNNNYNYTDDGTLGYYPMLSVFQGGIVGLNPGPKFKYPISEAHKPLSDRYEDRIAEEMVWDIIDEIEAEYLDQFE